MFTSKSKGIQEFIFDRLYKIQETILPTNREYREMGEDSAEIITRLFEVLPLEERQLLDEYDVSRNLRMNLEGELIYGLGLMDGVLLATWVDQVRRDPGKSLAELGFGITDEGDEK